MGVNIKSDFGVMRYGLASQGVYPESDAPGFEFQRTRFSKQRSNPNPEPNPEPNLTLTPL